MSFLFTTCTCTCTCACAHAHVRYMCMCMCMQTCKQHTHGKRKTTNVASITTRTIARSAVSLRAAASYSISPAAQVPALPRVSVPLRMAWHRRTGQLRPRPYQYHCQPWPVLKVLAAVSIYQTNTFTWAVRDNSTTVRRQLSPGKDPV